jgi:hypothetical protein
MNDGTISRHLTGGCHDEANSFACAAFFVACLLPTLPAQEQSRVFVAAQGSDSNPCTFALPMSGGGPRLTSERSAGDVRFEDIAEAREPFARSSEPSSFLKSPWWRARRPAEAARHNGTSPRRCRPSARRRRVRRRPDRAHCGKRRTAARPRPPVRRDAQSRWRDRDSNISSRRSLLRSVLAPPRARRATGNLLSLLGTLLEKLARAHDAAPFRVRFPIVR